MYMRGLADMWDEYGDAPPSFDQPQYLPPDVSYSDNGSIASGGDSGFWDTFGGGDVMSMPSIPRGGQPSAPNVTNTSPAPRTPAGSSPSPFGNATDWAKLITAGLNTYGQIKVAEIRADQNTAYPYTSRYSPSYTGQPVPRSYPGTYPGYSGGVGMGGMDTTTLLVLGVAGAAVIYFLMR